MGRKTVGIAVSLLFCTGAGALAGNIAINEGIVYQTIEGFGAHGSENVWWSSGPFATQSFVNTIVNELGLTVTRNEFYPDFEETNENGDPNNLDMSRFNLNGEFVRKQKQWLEALKNTAAQNGEPMKFIASYWSPPAWMKTNNSTVNGGNLRTAAYPEFAEYCLATAQAYKEQCGIDLYALSIQNEPAFSQYFNSCVYTAEMYRNVIKVVGPKLHAVYPNVKLFGAEDMLANWTRPGAFPGAVMSDPLAREHMGALAVHGYHDGVHPTPASEAAYLWGVASRNCTGAGIQLWMTETSGYSNDWSGARGEADAIFAALKYGKISMWVWWQLSGDHTAGEILMPLAQRGKLFYVAKQYYRYIRPGAVMVEATSDNDNVLTTAFHHRADRTLTVIALNWASSAQTITLSGNNLPSFTLYTTSSSDNCVNKGTVTNSFSLPANSVNTLYGTNYNTAVRTAHGVSGSRPTGSIPVAARVYSLDGRLLVKKTEMNALAQRAASGSYVAVLGLPDGSARTPRAFVLQR